MKASLNVDDKTMKYLIIIASFFCLISCTEQEVRPETLTGEYTGTFRVISENETTQANVSFEVKHSSFSGKSAQANHPAIGLGSLVVRGDELHFTNAQYWTADFDWNLILDGQYQFQYADKQLVFWKERNGTKYQYDLVQK